MVPGRKSFMNEAALKIENLSHRYDSDCVSLTDINIEIRENEFVGIIGQNGAGKSTLLKNITGLLRPQEGKISLFGKDIKNTPVSRIADTIGFVLQNPDRQLFADTVREEVAYSLVNRKTPEEEIDKVIADVLDSVGLSDKSEEFPPSLSKGDRAKVVIASVLAMDPRIIVLDEPTSGQDHRGCHQIMSIAQEFHKAGRTVIFVTHHMALVAEYAQRVIVMGRRTILMDDKTKAVFSKPDILATTGIQPPQIISLSQNIRQDIPFEGDILSVEELGRKLINKKEEVV
jgi:energy-coupling factor transport system ATP-binding protein